MSEPTTRRRLVRVGLSWLLVLGLVRVVIVPAENCGSPTPASVGSSLAEGVDWIVRNQSEDGSWLYRYDRAERSEPGGYNLARHAGTLMAVYQQHEPSLLEAGDRAASWAIDQLVPAGGGLSFGSGANAPVGASALLTAALVLRRDLTGDPVYDRELRELGRFLLSAVDDSGAVAGRWNTLSDRAVPDSASRFFTGETLYALALLGRALPDDGPQDDFVSGARAVMRYVAVERADAEGWFPPISDHWASYGLVELVRSGVELDDEEIAYARRLGGLFGVQVRYESQRTNSTLSWVTRGRQTLGAGLGTLGEGLGNLWWLAGEIEELADERPALAERARCVAGMLVERQAVGDGADRRERGAWFQFDVTQVDDQQHAVSALLLTSGAVAEEAGRP
jgi:hypothetical protein